MSYTLYIGDRMFSSWSLRGWLMLEKFGLPYDVRMVGLYAGTLAADLAHIAPARTVPAMTTPAGHVLTDSLAMAETLVEAHPERPLYPADPAARALARSICAEMHAGFGALRGQCPNMISHVWDGFVPSPAVLADLTRIEDLWALARARHGTPDSPWLFGAYSLADVFYAPVAMRITTYNLPVSAAAQSYVRAHLADRAFLAWRADALREIHDPWPYPMDLAQSPWPVNQS
jgi:glutathione S-transferase